MSDADAVGTALGRHAARGTDARGGCRGPPGGRLRPGPGRDALGSLLRVRDRRRTARGARCRLAGQRLGPERDPAQGHPGRGRRRGGRGHLVARPARPAVRQRRRLRHGCDDGQLHRARGRARRAAAARGLGPRSRARRVAPAPRAGRTRAASVGRGGAALPRAAGTDLVDVDAQGRVLPDELRRALAESPDQPTIVLLQAGNLHSGAFDPFEECIALGARARCLGARRRRLRPVGGRVAVVPTPHPGVAPRGLVGHGRAQDPERALRQRHRRRSRPRPR